MSVAYLKKRSRRKRKKKRRRKKIHELYMNN